MKKNKNQFQILERDIRRYLKLNDIQKVYVAVSGGADSVALLLLLKSSGVQIEALHCNFHLRGEESDRDENHVKKICEDIDVILNKKDFDVDSYLKNHKGCSLEMACRNLRYEWFSHFLSAKHVRIAVGHNADDNIETFFINALRGCGTKGLKGMVADNGEIWRPLLSIHRKDILSFLDEKNVSYITDSSNLKNDFRRNFLRNEVIPLLKTRWEGFDKAVDSTIKYCQEENKIVEKEIEKIITENPTYLSIDKIKKYPAPELLVRRFIEDLQPYTTTSSEIIAAVNAEKPSIKTWNLKKGKITLNSKNLIKI